MALSSFRYPHHIIKHWENIALLLCGSHVGYITFCTDAGPNTWVEFINYIICIFPFASITGAAVAALMSLDGYRHHIFTPCELIMLLLCGFVMLYIACCTDAGPNTWMEFTTYSICIIPFAFIAVNIPAVAALTSHDIETIKRKFIYLNLMLVKEAFNFNLKFRFYNRSLPIHIRILDKKLNETNCCGICREDLGGYFHDEVVLICGHRYHAKCIRSWECMQLETASKKFLSKLKYLKFVPKFKASYHCPLCRTEYRWNQKWSSNFKW